MKKIVVAIDGSEASKEVVDYAIHYANREKDAEILFLHVIAPVDQRPIFYAQGVAYSSPPVSAVKKDFEEFIRNRMVLIGKTIPKMSVFITTGRPYEQIVSFAEKEDADIIFIGGRGLNSVERFFLGSVAAKVVTGAPCSVYVHRQKGKPGEFSAI